MYTTTGTYFSFRRLSVVLVGMENIEVAEGFVLLTQYCAGDKMEKNEMGWACGAYG